MKRGRRYIIALVLVFTTCSASAQRTRIDSLLNVLKYARKDTSRVNALNKLSYALYLINPDTAILLADEAMTLARSINFKRGTAEASGYSGIAYWAKSDYPNALKFLMAALKIDEDINNKTGIAMRLNNLGGVYFSEGNYPKALEYYLKALKMDEELDNKKGITVRLGNIGLIYSEQGNYSLAQDYFLRAIEINIRVANKQFEANTLGNLGILNHRQAQIVRNSQERRDSLMRRAVAYHLAALKVAEEIGDKKGIARHLDNIGSTYFDQAKWPRSHANEKTSTDVDTLYAKALHYYTRALQVASELNDLERIASIIGNMGSLYYSQGRFDPAEVNLKKALLLSDNIGDLEGMEDWHLALSQLYNATGRYELALRDYKLHILYRDSISNEENTKKQTRLEMQYDFDKKTAADSVRTAEKKKQNELKHEQEIKQQKLYTYGGLGGFALMFIVAIVSINAFRNKKKANEIIERQKVIVEEKQKEILDSIHYAQRIQKSLMPTEKYISKYLDQNKN